MTGSRSDREAENEDGGDITDEPHDDDLYSDPDSEPDGSDEPLMGWSEHRGQTGVGVEWGWNDMDDADDSSVPLGFNGECNAAALQMLGDRGLPKRRRKESNVILIGPGLPGRNVKLIG